MAVRKPLEKTMQSALVDVEALIDKGAKVKEDQREEKKWTIINLRIPTEMLKEADEVVSNRVGISRNGWVLEAIHEKLKRDKLDA